MHLSTARASTELSWRLRWRRAYTSYPLTRLHAMQAEALEEQTTKVQKLQDTIAERQGKSRAELEVQLAQEAGKASGMQVHTPSDV